MTKSSLVFHEVKLTGRLASVLESDRSLDPQFGSSRAAMWSHVEPTLEVALKNQVASAIYRNQPQKNLLTFRREDSTSIPRQTPP